MIGAITGDIIGSVFEAKNVKTTNFKFINPGSRFTDDTVLTIAIADAFLQNLNFAEALKHWGRKYPNAGYDRTFYKWLKSDSSAPYGSWGNGSAMRVSPIGFTSHNLDTVLQKAKETAEITHNHPEGIKGAKAVAAAIFLARTETSKADIKAYIETEFNYNLNRTIEKIRPEYSFDVSCQGSVPEAITAFLEGTDFENTLRLAISIGGDSYTIACMAGGIAQAHYKEIPQNLISFARKKLTTEMLQVLDEFEKRYF